MNIHTYYAQQYFDLSGRKGKGHCCLLSWSNYFRISILQTLFPYFFIIESDTNNKMPTLVTTKLPPKHTPAIPESCKLCKYLHVSTPTSTLPQYKSNDSRFVQVLCEDWDANRKSTACKGSLGVRKNALVKCWTVTPLWWRMSHMGSVWLRFTHALAKSKAYASTRVKSETFIYRTDRGVTVFVSTVTRSSIQQVANSVFWSVCLRL